MATYLPPEEMIADFAAGATPPAVSLLMAAHLTQAPESRARVRAYEEAGGVMLRDEAPEAVSEDGFDAVLAMIGSDAPEPVTADPAPEAPEPCPIPRIVLDQIGLGFDEIPWKFKLPGVSAYDIDIDADVDQKVTLLRARPGATVPQHTHKGTELTLIMQGVMLDNCVEYSAGDVAVNTEDDDHRPKILGDEICYCLIVQQGDLHFTGRFSRILNYIGE